MKQKIIGIVIAAMFLQSCATICQSAKKTVVISCDPQDAKIYVDDRYIGSGDVIVKLGRDADHTVTVEKDDYNTSYLLINNHFQIGWLIADIFYFLPGCIIDDATGAWYTFEDHYMIQLDKK